MFEAFEQEKHLWMAKYCSFFLVKGNLGTKVGLVKSEKALLCSVSMSCPMSVVMLMSNSLLTELPLISTG